MREFSLTGGGEGVFLSFTALIACSPSLSCCLPTDCSKSEHLTVPCRVCSEFSALAEAEAEDRRDAELVLRKGASLDADSSAIAQVRNEDSRAA